MFKRILILFALRLLKSQLLDKIDYAPTKAFVGSSFRRLEKVADVLTDNNPADGEQLAVLWEAEKHQFVSDTLDTAIEVVKTEVHDPVVSGLVVDLLGSIREQQNVPTEPLSLA